METCLLLHGMILHASVDEQEQLMLALGRAASFEGVGARKQVFVAALAIVTAEGA